MTPERSTPAQSDRWPVWFLVVFQVAALVVIAKYLPPLWTDLLPTPVDAAVEYTPETIPPRPFVDFTQDWASARNYFEGRAIYASHLETYPQYLCKLPPGKVPSLLHNAHPPTSVLLMLPLGKLEHRPAMVVWHLFSFASLALTLLILHRQLHFQFTLWHLLPGLAFLLFLDAFHQQVSQGQWHLVLCALFTLAWAAARQERDVAAGVCIGLATALKLFPGFIVILFLLQGRWRAVVAAGITFLVLTLLTVLVLGWEAYRDYVTVVMPENAAFYANWNNSSITGFWRKLFVGGQKELVIPWIYSPGLALTGIVVCSAAVLASFSLIALRAKMVSTQDQAYALAMTAMLLLSPITWEHSLLMLLPAGFLFWQTLAGNKLGQYLFLFLVLSLTIYQEHCWWPLMQVNPWREPVGPAQILIFGTPFYLLVSFYVWQWWVAWQTVRRVDSNISVAATIPVLEK